MRVIDLEHETRPVGKLLGLARAQPLVFTRKGRPVAVLAKVPDEDIETLALRTNAEFLAYLQQCRERHRREGGRPIEAVRARFGLPPYAHARTTRKPVKGRR